ncbi:MAG TPA: ABC transporter substrate-binding protein [Burkholderiales bacterium]|nr:ABC transporter substrate-binding protein [Burkholderiales bacterium]
MSITLIENFRAVFYAPFYAASALGAYENEGLEVVIKPSSDAVARFVISGEGEVSWSGPLRLMNTLDKNPSAGVVAFCEIVGRDPFFLVGRAPRPSFRLQDLAGMRVGTVSEVPTPWICLRHDLRLAGVDETGIERTPGATMAENAAALRAGRLDVVQVFEPHAAALEADGAGHVWYAGASRGYTAYTTFNTTRAFLDRHPRTALQMCRAMYRTQKWIAAHSDADLAEAIAAYFPDLPARLLASSCHRYRSLGVWNRTPLPAREGFEWLRGAALADGLLRKSIPYEDCVDTRFAEQVVREDPPPL